MFPYVQFEWYTWFEDAREADQARPMPDKRTICHTDMHWEMLVEAQWDTAAQKKNGWITWASFIGSKGWDHRITEGDDQNFLVKMGCFLSETLKSWVRVQRGQSYVTGRCLFSLGWPSFYWWFHNKNALWGSFTSTSSAPHLFLLGWLKLNLALLLDQLRWLREMNAGGRFD